MKQLVDIKGQRIGGWTAIRFIRWNERPNSWSTPVWLFRCDCGTLRELNSIGLRGKSCGCKFGKHRHTSEKYGATPTYRSWANMVARCTQPSNPAFKYYKKRGIKVCRRWRKFENFLSDMGERPSPSHTLDRHPDNDGNYAPGNVRWATKTEQANNRITNRSFTYRGKQYTLANLARETGVGKGILRSRLCRSALPWTVEGAVHTPVFVKRGRTNGFCC